MKVERDGNRVKIEIVLNTENPPVSSSRGTLWAGDKASPMSGCGRKIGAQPFPFFSAGESQPAKTKVKTE